MEYRTIPGTDLRVSSICFGTWQFGDSQMWGKEYGEENAKLAVDTCFEVGFPYFKG
jgi:aryl-alcohol dehydrogenase-like predicted oxidoreductase